MNHLAKCRTCGNRAEVYTGGLSDVEPCCSVGCSGGNPLEDEYCWIGPSRPTEAEAAAAWNAVMAPQRIAD